MRFYLLLLEELLHLPSTSAAELQSCNLSEPIRGAPHCLITLSYSSESLHQDSLCTYNQFTPLIFTVLSRQVFHCTSTCQPYWVIQRLVRLVVLELLRIFPRYKHSGILLLVWCLHGKYLNSLILIDCCVKKKT